VSGQWFTVTRTVDGTESVTHKHSDGDTTVIEGFRVYFGNPNSKLAQLVAAGDCLGSLRNDYYLDAEILDWVLSKDAKVSRLDLAVTDWIDTEFLSLGDVETWYVNGLISSPLLSGGLKEISRIPEKGHRERETLYIGAIEKRGRKGIFRAYDKGIELGIGSEIVTRIELELKAKNAHSVAKRLAESNDIAGNFRSKFDVKAKDFERVMDADAVRVQRGKNQVKQDAEDALNARWDWLINQVAPALKQAVLDEKSLGLGDRRLIEFLHASGLLKDIQNGVVANANKITDNYFASIGIHNRKFSNEELD